MSRASTRRKADALSQRTKRSGGDARTLRTGLGLSTRAMALLAAALAAAAATWFFAVRPVGDEQAVVDRRTADVAAQNRALEGRIDAARAGEPDVLAGLEAQARTADDLLPRTISPIAALDLLLPHAQGFGVQVSINPSTSAPAPIAGGAAQALTVDFTGSEQAVRSWLAALDELQPMTTVSSLSMRFTDEGVTGSADVALWGSTTPPLTPATPAAPTAPPAVPVPPASLPLPPVAPSAPVAPDAGSDAPAGD